MQNTQTFLSIDLGAESGQPVPGTGAEVVRCVLESLALAHRSFDVTSYEPRSQAAWDEAYGRCLALRH